MRKDKRAQRKNKNQPIKKEFEEEEIDEPEEDE